MKLFELTSCCDDGYNGAIDLFWANSSLDVAGFVLAEIQTFIKENHNSIISGNYCGSSKGERYYSVVTRIKMEMNYSDGEYNRDIQWIERMKTMTPERLLEMFEESEIDGDSYFEVRIHEYDPGQIVTIQ